MSWVREHAGRAVLAGRRAAAMDEWPLVAGGGLALLAMVEVVVVSTSRRSGDGAGGLSAALLLALCGTVPLMLAWAHPITAAAAVAAATLLGLWTGYRPTVAGLAALLVVAYLAGHRSSRRAAVLIVLPFVLYALVPDGAGVVGPSVCKSTLVRTAADGGAVEVPQDPVTPDCGTGDRDRSARLRLTGSQAPSRLPAVLLLAAVAAAAGVGQARRSRAAASHRTASRRAIADTLEEHAARGERARIARELHDVVAHHISMIAVQAETARLTTAGMPAEGARRLTAIGDTARDALTEMRRLLGVLREDAGVERPAREPQPGLERLTELIDEARDSSGASTRLIVRGRVAPLDPGLELTAYRIVQEALTNARRHASGAAVDVELDYGDRALTVRVRDNGPGPRPGSNGSGPAGGHGLAGMAERVAMVGGTLRTGPAPGAGFLIDVVLPVPEPSG